MDLLASVNIWLFVAQGAVFLVVLAFLNKVLFQPILGLLHEREEKTEGFMRDAGAKEKAAESTSLEYKEKLRQARKEVLEAKKQYIAEGTNTRTELLEKARKEANQSLEEIKSGIATASEEARKALGEQIETLGKEIAERVLRRSL